MQPDLYICEAHEVSDPGCYEFSLQVNSGELEGFIVHWRGRWFAYRNHCPHTGVNLNWQPHQFFDYENRLLQCSLHGALFAPDTGLCIHGPCLGDSLQRLPVVQTGTALCLQHEGFLPHAAQDRPKSL